MVIYTDFEMFLYGIGVLLLFIAALQYLGLARKKENLNEKLINRAFGIVYICITIQFSFLVLYLLSLEGNLELENISLLSEWLYRSSWIPWYTFNAIFFRAVEKIQDKKIPVGPILGIISIFLVIFLPFDIFLILIAIPLLIVGCYYLHVLFTLMKWAKKELKAATSFVILGSMLVTNSVIDIIPMMMMIGVIPSIVLPLSLITGAVLGMAPTILNPKLFLRSTRYWYVFFASVIGYSVFLLIFSIIFIPEYSILSFILLICYSLECAFFLKSILKEERGSNSKKVDVSGVFTRPETITEEEVSVSKEKKVCLVCKGKIFKFNYMCPDCESFYCEKCYNALVEIENACWACNTALDESKPSKPFKQKKEEVVVEEGVPKKGVGGMK